MTVINTVPTPTGVSSGSWNADPRGNPVLEAQAITTEVDGVPILRPVSLSILPGEVVGIAGGSGAGKTTLLETIAGVRTPSSGRLVRRRTSAFVPQDDIIHRELPLRRTLLHAASLRVADRDAAGRAAVVDRALEQLDLSGHAEVTVGDLSGGQRKRASLAAEMLTDANLLFLDEPTSGLDPAMAAELMRSFRDLAAAGSSVVLSTHSPADLARCDRVVFVGPGGRVAFVGTPDEAKAFFDAGDLVEIYELLHDTAVEADAECDLDRADRPARVPIVVDDGGTTGAPSPTRQFLGLVRRNLDLIGGNRLTLAILVGSPALIIAMMTALFPAGAFDADAGSAALAVQTLFWLAFNSFFFGITYGLLQVVGELEVVRRERRIGLSISAYVASKLAVLTPMLAVVNAAQLFALESAGRLPETTAGEWVAMFVSLQLLSTAAVVIGLHASSAVQNSSQATLALPMLCFPQVLFAGAVVPVSEMGGFSEAMSLPLAVRWGFEPLGRILDMGPAASQESGTAGFADAFEGSVSSGWFVLLALAALGSAATVRTLRRRTAPGRQL